MKVAIIQEETINPFDIERNREIFKNLAKLIVIYLILQMIRGSEKFPSIIGVPPCSFLFWIIYLSAFLIVAAFSYFNLQTLKVWMVPEKDSLIID